MKKIIDGVKETMVKKLDLPREVIMNSYKIIIEGDELLTVENHRGVIKFREDEVILRVKNGQLVINGKDFKILYISGKTLKLGGVFKGVKYDQA